MYVPLTCRREVRICTPMAITNDVHIRFCSVVQYRPQACAHNASYGHVPHYFNCYHDRHISPMPWRQDSADPIFETPRVGNFLPVRKDDPIVFAAVPRYLIPQVLR